MSGVFWRRNESKEPRWIRTRHAHIRAFWTRGEVNIDFGMCMYVVHCPLVAELPHRGEAAMWKLTNQTIKTKDTGTRIEFLMEDKP